MPIYNAVATWNRNSELYRETETPLIFHYHLPLNLFRYRVAAIFPDCFQSLIVPLKINLFYNFFFRKTVSAICRNLIKNKQSHSGKNESTGRRSSRDSLQTLRRTYHDSQWLKAFGNINKSTVYDGKRKFDKLWETGVADSWKSPLDLLAGWHPCLRKQEDAGLAHGGLTVRCGGVGGGGLGSQLA